MKNHGYGTLATVTRTFVTESYETLVTVPGVIFRMFFEKKDIDSKNRFYLMNMLHNLHDFLQGSWLNKKKIKILKKCFFKKKIVVKDTIFMYI